MIKKIIDSANEIASFKRSLGMDAAPWTMDDCLTRACKEQGVKVNIDLNGYASANINGRDYFFCRSNGQWETGWI